MKFQYLVYKKWEMERGGRRLPGFKELLGTAGRHQVDAAEIESGTLCSFLEERQIPPGDVLVLAASDETLREAAAVSAAVLACRNPDFPSEELYQADFLAEELTEADYYFLERVYQRKHGIPWRVIETERCYLREMTLSDLPDLYRLYGEKGMTDYMEPLYEWEEEAEYTKAYIQNMYRFYGYGMWLVMDRNTDELIGRAGFEHYRDNGEDQLEMGYMITPSRQRQGYAAEVCLSMLEYAKCAQLGYDRVYCYAREENTASLALLLKLGFRFQKQCFRGQKKMRCYVFLL